MSNTALFPGTFDPITYGHLDLVQRASVLFKHVIIGVAADSFGKSPLFDTKKRLALVQKAVKSYKNVRVISFSGLTVECAKEEKAQVLLRGIRSGNDLAYELQMAAMNRHLAPNIDTLFLSPSPKYSHISSSFVRQIAELHGDLSGLVPEHVLEALHARFSR